MLTDVQYRRSVRDRLVIPVQVYDESVQSDWTVTVDSEDLLFGKRSVRFVVAGTASNGDIASDSISSTDFSRFTHIEFPIKVSTAVAASDLAFRLDDTASNSSPVETIVLPAVSARTDTWIRLALANPELDTAIISVALEYNANVGANRIWIGEVRATSADSEEWESLHPREWRIEKPCRDLLISPGGRERVGYKTIKLIGGDEPVTLCADGTVTQVDGYFVSSRATELMLNSLGPARTERQERDRIYWHGEAALARKAFVVEPGKRDVE